MPLKLLDQLFTPSRFRRDVCWNIGSLAVLGLSGLVINALILTRQGPEALGVFNQVFAFFIVVSQVAVGGLQSSVLKQCSYVQSNLPECARIVSSALILTTAAGVPVCFGLFLLRHTIGSLLESPAVALGLTFALPGLFLFSFNKVFIMALNGLRHMRAFAIFQALRYIMILVGVVVVIARGWPGSHLALSLTLAEMVLFAALIAYIRCALFPLQFSFSPVMRAWFRRHISFGARGFLSGVLIEMNTRVDVMMVGYFMSDAMVGLYSFASTFAEGFAQLCNVLRNNVDPLVGKAFSEGDKERITELARKIRTTFSPLMALLGAVLVAGFPLLIGLLTSKEENWQSWGVFAILMGGIVLGAGYRPFIALSLQGGRPGTFTLLTMGSVFTNAILNISFIPWLGIFGSALATATVYVLEVCAVIVLARRLFGIQL